MYLDFGFCESDIAPFVLSIFVSEISAPSHHPWTSQKPNHINFCVPSCVCLSLFSCQVLFVHIIYFVNLFRSHNIVTINLV